MKSTRLKKLLPWIRLGVSVALLWLVLQKTSSEALMQSFQTAATRWPYLLFGFVVLGLTVVAAIARWRVLLLSLGSPPRWRFLFGAFMVGAFFNQFLPSTIGGDVVRGWWLRDDLKSGTVSIMVVAVDRFFGVIGLCALGLIAAAVQPDAVHRLPAFWIVVGLVGLGCFGSWMLTRSISVSFGRRLLSVPLLNRAREKAYFAYRGLRIVSRAPRALVGAFLLSLVVQALIVAQYLLLAAALGLSINLWELAVLVPIVTLVTWLPLTINGIGLREASLIALAGTFGMGPADAVALSWLFVLYTWPTALIGAVVYFIGRPDKDVSAAAGAPLPKRQELS